VLDLLVFTIAVQKRDKSEHINKKSGAGEFWEMDDTEIYSDSALARMELLKSSSMPH
jgi:hypothetical protein